MTIDKCYLIIIVPVNKGYRVVLEINAINL